MTCPSCGAQNLDNAVFCSQCARNLRAGPAVPIATAAIAQRTSGMAIAGFVLAFFCGVLGLIFSIIGYNECKRSDGRVTGQGLAIAGIVLSSLGIVGMLSAIAIPAFMDYMSHSRSTEATVNLRRLGAAVKSDFLVNARFRVGHEGPTPAVACCDQPGQRCDDPSAWQSGVWRMLDFEVTAPHRFQYTYDSDGTTVEATAIGDPECRGKPVIYRLHVIERDGTPVATVVRP